MGVHEDLKQIEMGLDAWRKLQRKHEKLVKAVELVLDSEIGDDAVAIREVLRKALDEDSSQADLGGASGASSTAMISAERARQITAEGWTAEHDDRHSRGSLAEAAACYARPKREMIEEWDDDEDRAVMVPVGWPWEPRFWRPTPDDRVRELVKAGALIAAEIDRLLRVAEVSGGTSTGSARPPHQDFDKRPASSDGMGRTATAGRATQDPENRSNLHARVVLLEEALRRIEPLVVDLSERGWIKGAEAVAIVRAALATMQKQEDKT